MESLDVGSLLRLEYERLQASIDKFDDQRFKIKGWTITVAGAFFAFAINGHEAWLAAGGAVVVAFFFYLELVFMDIQQAAISRSNDIEELLDRAGNGHTVEGYTFGIGKVFAGTFRWRNIPDLLHHRPHISVFYSALMILLTLGSVLLATIR